jgi:hypothetical protein
MALASWTFPGQPGTSTGPVSSRDRAVVRPGGSHTVITRDVDSVPVPRSGGVRQHVVADVRTRWEQLGWDHVQVAAHSGLSMNTVCAYRWPAQRSSPPARAVRTRRARLGWLTGWLVSPGRQGGSAHRRMRSGARR